MSIVCVFGLALLVAGGEVEELFPPAIVSFQPADPEALFSGAGPGHWDALIRERGWILHENGVYRLWFTGYVDKKQGPMSLGYATSTDGIRWTRHAANPIFRDAWVEDMQVVRDGEILYMFAEGKGDQAQLLTSTDGLEWKRVGTLDVRKTTGQPIPPGPFGTPTAWKEDGVWNLFYERMDRGVWWARSSDMTTWTNVSDEPVLRPGPASYDASAIAVNQVVKHRGRYYALYHGLGNEGPGRWTTCVAVSSDLREWVKYPNNPLTPPAANQSSGILVPDGEVFRLYTMHPDVRLHRPISPPAPTR
jgi:predicted GH43/DUF377 family glycosyl hydrolase